MKHARLVMVSVIVFSIGSAALADWRPGDGSKMHFPQLPDLDSGLGMNVLATEPKVLADDFRCTQTGPITGIHIWGSWLEDRFPLNVDPGLVGFHLSIHDDVAKDDPGNPYPYSHPGDSLWEWQFMPGEFSWRSYATSEERFFDPNTNEIIGHDTRVFQYNFHIADTAMQFIQERGKIYWLDVMAIPIDDPNAMFGWKTSENHWNDDSVYSDFIAGGFAEWRELIDPDTGISLHQAFVITPEPATISLLCIGGLAILGRRRRRR